MVLGQFTHRAMAAIPQVCAFQPPSLICLETVLPIAGLPADKVKPVAPNINQHHGGYLMGRTALGAGKCLWFASNFLCDFSSNFHKCHTCHT